VKEKTPKFIHLGKDSTLMPFVARFTRTFIDALLGKNSGLTGCASKWGAFFDSPTIADL